MKFFSKKQINKSLFVLLFDNQSTYKYYKLNTGFLFSYSCYSLLACTYLDYPEHLKSTIKYFGMLTTAGLLGILLFSNRHIKSIVHNKTQEKLILETFRGFGLLTPKVIELNIKNDIRFIYSVKSKLKIVDSGLYIIKLRENNIKLFKLWNFLIMRPVNILEKDDFNSVFKKLIKK